MQLGLSREVVERAHRFHKTLPRNFTQSKSPLFLAAAAASAEADFPRTCSAGWTFGVHITISLGFCPNCVQPPFVGHAYLGKNYLKTSAEPHLLNL